MAGKTITSSLIVSLIDGVTGPAAKAGAALTALQKKASGSFGAASAFLGVKRLGGAMTEFRDAMYGPAGIAAALAGHQMFEAQVSYETSMNRIKATSRASAEELEHLRDVINGLAIKYPKKRAEIAEGALQLFKSGKNVDEVMGSLEPTLTAALATEQTIGHAGETLTDIVFGMGLRATNAKEAMEAFTQVADVSVVASNAFNQSYDMFVSGMAKAAPIARITGMTLRDVATVVGILADEGFKGEQGGTAFASSILRLGNQTKKARAELAAAGLDLSEFVHKTDEVKNLGGKALADVLQEELGVDATTLIPSFDNILKNPKINESGTLLGRELQKAIVAGLEMDANSPNIGKARDALDTFLRGSMSKMDIHGIFRYLAEHDADKNLALMSELFGKNHAPKIIALINAYRQGLYDKRNEFIGEHENGAAQDYAKTLQEGLPGALHKLGSAWDHMGEVLFVNTGLIDHIATAFDKLRGVLSALRDANPGILKALGYGMAGLVSAGAAAIAFDMLKIATKGLQLAFVALTSPIGIVVAGLGAIAYYRWDAIAASWKDFSEGFSQGFWSKLKIPDDVGNSWSALKKEFEGISGLNLDLPTWSKLGVTLGGAVATGVNALATAFGAVCEGITKAIGLAKEAGKAFSAVGDIRLGGGSNDIMRGSPKRLPGRAAGGPVTGGAPYIVGERGPELFVPGSSGGIVPNGKLGGQVTVTNHFNISSTADAAEIAREVARKIERGINEAFRGAQADVGLRWA
jgi:hypothetical protein